MKPSELKHVDYLRKDEEVKDPCPVERLMYRSNILGADQRITNTGGGSTSPKSLEQDPLVNEEIEVLWVKSSGRDLRTDRVESFSSLYQGKLLGLERIYRNASQTSVKTTGQIIAVDGGLHEAFLR
jgi:rhamnose utilization protein RhaD (predicted bifunctional aldolase and dehydrogenase)